MFFTRAFNKEFNYTNNPTAIDNTADGSITANLTANPTTFITSVHLYYAAGDMVAVGNLSTALKKNFSTEATIKVKLTY